MAHTPLQGARRESIFKYNYRVFGAPYKQQHALRARLRQSVRVLADWIQSRGNLPKVATRKLRTLPCFLSQRRAARDTDTACAASILFQPPSTNSMPPTKGGPDPLRTSVEEMRELQEEEARKKKQQEEHYRASRTEAGENLLKMATSADSSQLTKALENTRFHDLTNYTNYEGFTPLHKAAMCASPVISTPTCVHSNHRLIFFVLFLLVRCRYDKSMNATSLLDAGANIDQQEDRGRTPLMCAAANGCTGVAKLLIGKGAKTLEARARNGWAAAHFAAANAHAETLEMLLEVDDPATVCSIRGADGLGPLELAMSGADRCVEEHRSDFEATRALANYRKVIEILQAFAPPADATPSNLHRRGSMRRASTAQAMAQNALTYARRFSAWGVHRAANVPKTPDSTSSPTQYKASNGNGRKPSTRNKSRASPKIDADMTYPGDAPYPIERANVPSPVAQQQPAQSPSTDDPLANAADHGATLGGAAAVDAEAPAAD